MIPPSSLLSVILRAPPSELIPPHPLSPTPHQLPLATDSPVSNDCRKCIDWLASREPELQNTDRTIPLFRRAHATLDDLRRWCLHDPHLLTSFVGLSLPDAQRTIEVVKAAINDHSYPLKPLPPLPDDAVASFAAYLTSLGFPRLSPPAVDAGLTHPKLKTWYEAGLLPSRLLLGGVDGDGGNGGGGVPTDDGNSVSWPPFDHLDAAILTAMAEYAVRHGVWPDRKTWLSEVEQAVAWAESEGLGFAGPLFRKHQLTIDVLGILQDEGQLLEVLRRLGLTDDQNIQVWNALERILNEGAEPEEVDDGKGGKIFIYRKRWTRTRYGYKPPEGQVAIDSHWDAKTREHRKRLEAQRLQRYMEEKRRSRLLYQEHKDRIIKAKTTLPAKTQTSLDQDILAQRKALSEQRKVIKRQKQQSLVRRNKEMRERVALAGKTGRTDHINNIVVKYETEDR